RERRGEAVKPPRLFARDPELALPVTRPRVRMRRRALDVRVDAERDRGDRAMGRCDRRERAELALALDVEAEDPRLERGLHLRRRLPDTAENDPIRRDPRPQRTVQLAAAHDV